MRNRKMKRTQQSKDYDYFRSYFCLKNVKSLEDLTKKQSKFDKILESLIIKLGRNKENKGKIKSKDISVLMIFDKDVSLEVEVYMLFALFYRVFELDPNKIKNFLSNNAYFIKDIKIFLQLNYSKIINFLEKYSDYLKKESLHENLIKPKKKDSLKDLIFIKDKVSSHFEFSWNII
jgi:hypothetical protein